MLCSKRFSQKYCVELYVDYVKAQWAPPKKKIKKFFWVNQSNDLTGLFSTSFYKRQFHK